VVLPNSPRVGGAAHVARMTSTGPARPRKTPCASCPYRCAAPSGVWDPEEYAKLERYDAETMDQPAAVFHCHLGPRDVCAGWLGHREHPTDLLAVRLGLLDGRLDPSCAEYTTGVPLFDSGAAAAAHGIQDITAPDERARATIAKIVRVRGAAEDPVQVSTRGR